MKDVSIEACIKAYEVLKDYQFHEKVVQFIPEQGDQLFSIHESYGVVDIGISKRQYLKIFKQAHDYWHQNRDDFVGVNSSYTLEKLKNLYYVTIGYLLTTNDHQMMIKLHERILAQIYQKEPEILEIEFEILTTLISSKLSKVNKNSLLWLSVKKLTMILIYNTDQLQDQTPLLFDILVKRVFKSCKYHFSNYYGNYFLKWLIQINRALGYDNLKILSQLISHCHENLSDVSLWTNLHAILYANDCKNMVEDYNQTIRDINTIFSLRLSEIGSNYKDEHITSDITQIITAELEWLLSVECHNRTPYILLISQEQRHTVIPRLQSKLAYEKGNLTNLNQESLLHSSKLQFIETLEYIVKLGT